MEILDSHQVSQRDLKYAGFWIRVAAFIIDLVVVYIGIFLFALVASGLLLADGGSIFDGTNDSGVVGMIIFAYILILLGVVSYFAILESSEKQATLGKMAVGIKVGNSRGEKISFWNAVGRYLSKMLSGMILYIGYIMVAFDGKKQGLHDKIADTYVYYR
jgi:uncharacterized RDD family membrane protein YckC